MKKIHFIAISQLILNMPLRNRSLTENGFVNYISIRKTHFNGMFIVLNGINIDWNVVVNENNIAIIMQGCAKGELSHVLFVLQRNFLPNYTEGSTLKEKKTNLIKVMIYNFVFAFVPLSLVRTKDSFDKLVSKLAINGAIYCVAASQECT